MFSINIESYLTTRKVLIFSNKKNRKTYLTAKYQKTFFFVFKNKKEGVLNPFYLFFENYFKNNYG